MIWIIVSIFAVICLTLYCTAIFCAYAKNVEDDEQ